MQLTNTWGFKMAISHQKTKYRPYLTPSELDIIIDSLKITGSNPYLIHYLSGFKDKIELGLTVPNLTLTPRIGVMERLGLDEPSLDTISIKPMLVSISRQQAYIKWTNNPASCSASEIEKSQVYRFENDLMSEEEETAYLTRAGI
jgi:hypothetical protein